MPETPSMSRSVRIRLVACAVALMVLSVLPYVSGLHHAFVYDDHGQIVENPFLESAGRWPALLTLSTLNDPAIINGRRPVVLASYVIDASLWGQTPWGWRLHNWLLLACSTAALYLLWARILHRIEPKRPRNAFAFLAALLFAWHPALIEAVQVPAFRPDLMVVLFAALALHGACWCAWSHVRSRHWAGGTIYLLGVAAALLSKESGAVVPVLLALMWWCWPETRPSRRVMWMLVGGGLVLVGGLAWYAARPMEVGLPVPSMQAVGAEWNGRSLLPPSNGLTLPWLWWAYWRIALWPVPLIVDRVVLPIQSVLEWRFLWGLAFSGVSLTAVWWARRRAPWIAFGLIWMGVAFAPVSNAVPLLNPMAERYMPLMLVGFGLMAAYLLSYAGFKGKGRGVTLRMTVLAFWLVACWVIAHHRVRDFTNDEALWHRTLHDEPLSARAHTWMGLIHLRQQQWPEAIEYFGKAHVLNPRDLTSLINKATLYARLGDYAEAERLLQQAVSIRPSFAPAHWHLAVVLKHQMRYAEALGSLNNALRLDPYHVAARKERIILLVHEEQYAEALQDAEWLMAYAPSDAELAHAVAFLRDLLQIENRP